MGGSSRAVATKGTQPKPQREEEETDGSKEKGQGAGRPSPLLAKMEVAAG